MTSDPPSRQSSPDPDPDPDHDHHHHRRGGRWWALGFVAVMLSVEGGLALHERASHVACETADHGACALPAAAQAHGPAAEEDGDELPAGPAVVELTSEACPACRRMEPVLRDARAQCTAAGASVVNLDVESISGGALATRLHVTGTPTLVLFDAAHHEVTRLEGSRSLGEVRQAIEHAYGIACASIAPSPVKTGG